MPPKLKPTFEVLFEGKQVKCQAQRGERLTVGIEGTGPGGKRFVVTKRVGEDAEAAALRKLREIATAGCSGGDDYQSSLDSLGNVLPHPVQNEAGGNVQPGLFDDPSNLPAEIEAAAGVDLDAPVRTRGAENCATVDRLDASSSLAKGELKRMQGCRSTGQRRKLSEGCSKPRSSLTRVRALRWHKRSQSSCGAPLLPPPPPAQPPPRPPPPPLPHLHRSSSRPVWRRAVHCRPSSSMLTTRLVKSLALSTTSGTRRLRRSPTT